jgi:hypothetical protein
MDICVEVTVFWNVALCSLVEINLHFRGAYCLHYKAIIAIMMEAARNSETSVSFYQTTRCNILSSAAMRPSQRMR